MSTRFRVVILGMICAVVLTACAAPQQKKQPTVFFPESPALPRIQFLTSFAGQKDIEEDSAFDVFVRGPMPTSKLDKPYGVAIYDGKIYVCDTNVNVAVFDLKQRKFHVLEGATGPGKLLEPQNISIENDGTKYVADSVRGQVVVFDREDRFVKAYGRPGTWRPVAAVPFEDRLYVADMQNGVIAVLDKNSGEVVRTIGKTGEDSEKLFRPTNLAIDQEGYLYVSDFSRFQIVKYDRDGHFLAAFGKLGDSIGTFARPRGVAVDREGHIYVADAAFNNVQIFDKNGQALMFFGYFDNLRHIGAMMLPAQITVDYDNLSYFQKYADPSFEISALLIVTNQFGPQPVNVYGLGKEKGKQYPSDEELRKIIIEEKKKQELQKSNRPEDQDSGQKGKDTETTGSPVRPGN